MPRIGKSLFALAVLALALGCIVGSGIAQDKAHRNDGAIALVLDIRDAIGPATSDYFVRTLERGRESNARLIILQLDTPGGLDAAMRDMVRAMLSSEIPVVTLRQSSARAPVSSTQVPHSSPEESGRRIERAAS